MSLSRKVFQMKHHKGCECWLCKPRGKCDTCRHRSRLDFTDEKLCWLLAKVSWSDAVNRCKDVMQGERCNDWEGIRSGTDCSTYNTNSNRNGSSS